eukprot:1087360-Pleurochrysis_carterae.AAC.1
MVASPQSHSWQLVDCSSRRSCEMSTTPGEMNAPERLGASNSPSNAHTHILTCTSARERAHT